MCFTPIYMDSLYVHLPRRFASKGLLTAFLAVLTLAFPARHVLGENSTPDSKKASLTKPQDAQTQKGWKLPRSDNKDLVGGLGREDDAGGALRQMIVYSVIIVALGVAAVLIIKKLLPRIHRSAGKNLSIIETAYISPRSSVHLLRVGTKKYLISRSGDGVSLLAEVTQALDDEEITPGSAE